MLRFWMSLPSSLVTLNGKDLRQSSASVSHGLLWGSCSEPVLLLGNLFFSTPFITLGAQVMAVVSAPGAGFSASVTMFSVTTFKYLLDLTISDWITLHNLLDIFSLFFWLNVSEESTF